VHWMLWAQVRDLQGVTTGQQSDMLKKKGKKANEHLYFALVRCLLYCSGNPCGVCHCLSPIRESLRPRHTAVCGTI
jgi:hypothetical protein